jgi:hypothetical protein
VQFSSSSRSREESLPIDWAFNKARAPAPASAMPAAASRRRRSRPRRAAAKSVKTGIVAVRIVVLIAVVRKRPKMKRTWLKETPRSPYRTSRGRSPERISSRS